MVFLINFGGDGLRPVGIKEEIGGKTGQGATQAGLGIEGLVGGDSPLGQYLLLRCVRHPCARTHANADTAFVTYRRKVMGLDFNNRNLANFRRQNPLVGDQCRWREDGPIAAVGCELLQKIVEHGQPSGFPGFVIHADEQEARLPAAGHVVRERTDRLAKLVRICHGTCPLDPERFQVGHQRKQLGFSKHQKYTGAGGLGDIMIAAPSPSLGLGASIRNASPLSTYNLIWSHRLFVQSLRTDCSESHSMESNYESCPLLASPLPGG